MVAKRSIVTHQPDVACDVCGRRLLRGERPEVFIGAGRRRTVCELCIPRATGEGWRREADLEAAARGGRGGEGGRSLLERLRPRREPAGAPVQPPPRKLMRRLLQVRDDGGEGDEGASLDETRRSERSGSGSDRSGSRSERSGGRSERSGGEPAASTAELGLERTGPRRIDVSRRAQGAPRQGAQAGAEEWREGASEHSRQVVPENGPEGGFEDGEEVGFDGDRDIGVEEDPGFGFEEDSGLGFEEDPAFGLGEGSGFGLEDDADGRLELGLPSSAHAHREANGTELLLEEAIDRFNASECAKRVAGIARALGSPLVRVAHAGGQRVEVLLAWELCWYRYGVDVHQPSTQPLLLAEGMELHELPAEDQRGNALADEQGRLRLAA